MEEKRRQDERLQVRCTSEEKATMQAAAELENRNLSNFVVTAAVEKARAVLKKAQKGGA
jgi:uncharacterized protein (DUF1778 family)